MIILNWLLRGKVRFGLTDRVFAIFFPAIRLTTACFENYVMFTYKSANYRRETTTSPGNFDYSILLLSEGTAGFQISLEGFKMVKPQDAYKWNKNLFFVEHNPEKIVGRLFEASRKEFGISILGLEQVCQKDLPVGRRFLWISSLLLCCTLVAYYVTSRVVYILSLPTQVAVTLGQNDSLVLPDVTICPTPLFSPAKLKALGMTPEGGIGVNTTVATSESLWIHRLWKSMAHTQDIIAVTLVNLENSRPNWHIVFTTMGVCFRHHYEGRIQSSGINFGLQLKINWAKFYVHESNEKNTGLKIFFHSGKDDAQTEIDGIHITPGEDINIAIRLKEFQSLNRTAHPCIYAHSYSKSHCVNRCFSSALFTSTQCELPFMPPKSQDPGNSNSSECRSIQSYNRAMEEFQRERYNVTLWAGCGQGCLIECTKVVYTPFVESVAPSIRNVSKLVFYFPEMSYEIVHEKEGYDLIALLCDIGGTFGLFLGSSVLTVVELLEFLCIFIFKKCQK